MEDVIKRSEIEDQDRTRGLRLYNKQYIPRTKKLKDS